MKKMNRFSSEGLNQAQSGCQRFERRVIHHEPGDSRIKERCEELTLSPARASQAIPVSVNRFVWYW